MNNKATLNANDWIALGLNGFALVTGFLATIFSIKAGNQRADQAQLQAEITKQLTSKE